MSNQSRSAYVDLSRGLAVVCMVLHHSFDAWMPDSFHGSAPDRLFRFLGGVAAPTFLFLAGLAMVLMMEGLVARGQSPAQAARKAARRGAVILLGAFLFRFQEWALAFGASPAWTMLRVDILNCIGLSLVAVALLYWLGRGAGGRLRAPLFFLAASVVVAVAPLVAAADLSALPQLLADYLNGGPPRAWFPLFPWSAYAFAGALLGLPFAALRRAGSGPAAPLPAAGLRARLAGDRELRLLGLLAAAALAVWVAVRAVDGLPFTLYPKLDWWRSSPAYFLLRCCSLVLTLAACGLVDRLWRPVRARAGWKRPGPLVAMGQHSLIIYWVHVELVYGRWTWPLRGKLSLAEAALALVALLGAMVALAYSVDPVRGWLAARLGPRTARA